MHLLYIGEFLDQEQKGIMCCRYTFSKDNSSIDPSKTGKSSFFKDNQWSYESSYTAISLENRLWS